MPGTFLQSAEWKKFQEALGRKVWRAGENLIVRHDLPGGFNYLYCPRPERVNSSWLLAVQGIARGERSVFLKIDPVHHLPVTSCQLLVTNPIQPRKTAILDLQKSEGELLRAMREKTRYNIRLAERHGARVDQRPTTNDQRLIDTFWGTLQETAERDKFYTHERQYYEKLLAARSEGFSNELFFAEYEGKVIAAAIVNFYKPDGTATYLHGASRREHKEVMAPYLLHWRIIQDAKRRGFAFYDFWGIDEKRWPGLTRFKMGFGGEVVEYPQSVDIVYRPMWYKIYKFSRSIGRAM